MYLKEIQEIITEQSAKCSNIGREIGFGLTAVTWAFFFSDKQFSSSFLLITALILGILYFFIDFTQYYFMLIKYKQLYINTQVAFSRKNNIIDDGVIERALLATKSEINKTGFRFFFIKFPLLLLSFIFLLIYIIEGVIK